MANTHVHGQVAAGVEIPLPGHYPCLTLQLNVTCYQSAKVGRMVAIVREPSDHIEVRRVHADALSPDELAQVVVEGVEGLLADMRYLQGHL